MTRTPRVTREQLQEVLKYHPKTGEFRWLKRVGYRIRVGDIAGCVNKLTGYRVINIYRRTYLAHQLAWLYMTGCWPRPSVDHRDLDRANNRWSNLRRATRSQNVANRRPARNNTSGFKGVYRCRASGRWVARIRKDGRKYYLGRFPTPQGAHAAYMAAARELYGEFARAE
jgi:HNH endonuclease/AP2 domain